MPECVNETFRQQHRHFSPFFKSETGVADIRFDIPDIDFLVGNIQIATENDRLAAIQFRQMLPHPFFPLQPEREARQIPLRIRCINIYQIKSREFERQNPAFRLLLQLPDPISNGKGLLFVKTAVPEYPFFSA